MTRRKPLIVWITTNWKVLEEMVYHTTIPASWETCIQVKKQQLEPYWLVWKTEQLKIGKGIWPEYILSLCLFNLYAEYIMWNARLDELQAGIKIARRNINNLRYADDSTLMAESKEELKKNLLMTVKEESEKLGLKSTFKKWRSWHPAPSLHGK